MAGGANLDDDDDEITGINVTPLVDIMLVLLIIFMVASNYIVQEAIEVNLPKAATGEEVNRENKMIAVIIKQDGRLFLDGEPTTRDALSARAAALSKEPNASAMIAADRAVSHGEVVGLIDLIRASGLEQFAINIDPENDPEVGEAQGEAQGEEQGEAQGGAQGTP